MFSTLYTVSQQHMTVLSLLDIYYHAILHYFIVLYYYCMCLITYTAHTFNITQLYLILYLLFIFISTLGTHGCKLYYGISFSQIFA